MGVRSIPYTFFSCDFPGCKKELISELKFDEAIKEARKIGWSYSDSYHYASQYGSLSEDAPSRQVRCPEHRWKYSHKRRKPSRITINIKHDIVQLLNPKSKHWVVIDKTDGKILKYSRTSKPYKDILIISPSNTVKE